ncbi:MAG: rRNA maturation RNase YbeY [Parcubacteria group bacterium]|jgi:probable rRNA maturation factor
MKFDIEINNQEKCSLAKKYFDDVASKTIKLSRIKFSGKISISLAIVSEREIKRINRIYRKKNKVTDILSFSEYPQKKEKDIFCELIVCLAYVKKSSEIDKISLKKEMAYVVSHGILHCIGFGHSKKMYEIQDEVCKKYR